MEIYNSRSINIKRAKKVVEVGGHLGTAKLLNGHM